jgi:hypothetical protein
MAIGTVAGALGDADLTLTEQDVVNASALVAIPNTGFPADPNFNKINAPDSSGRFYIIPENGGTMTQLYLNFSGDWGADQDFHSKCYASFVIEVTDNYEVFS